MSIQILNYFFYYLLFNVVLSLMFIKSLKQLIAEELKNKPKEDHNLFTTAVTLLMLLGGLIFIGQDLFRKFINRGKIK